MKNKYFAAILALFLITSDAMPSGITNGQAVNAATSNAAWLAKNGNDTTTGIITLAKADVATSGSTVSNVQRYLNSLASSIGIATSSAYNYTITWASDAIGTANQTIQHRIESIVTYATALVSDVAYDVTTWDGDTTHAASKNAIRDQMILLAPLSSAALIGIPTAPTASPGNNSTQIATTAYADAIAALKANIASPTFTGIALAPTASVGTNTTQIATTAFVIANAGTGGGGGGGVALNWQEPSNSPLPIYAEDKSLLYSWSAGLAQNLQTSFKVPSTYVAGHAIKLLMPFYSASYSSGNDLMTTVSTLILTGTNAMSVTTNQRTSTNSAATPAGSEIPNMVTFDLTDSTGHINSVVVNPNDVILINLTRGTDTDTSDIHGLVYSGEITLQ